MSKRTSKHRATRPMTQTQHPALLRLVQAERWPDVEVEAKKILRLRSKDPFALKALGCSLTKQARETEAVPILLQALVASPADSEICNNLGISYLFTGRTEQAIENFEKALALNPKDYVVWKNLGNAYLRLKRPSKAIEAASRAIELHPDNYQDALLILACAFSLGGQLEQTLNIYREIWEHGEKHGLLLADMIYTTLQLVEWDLYYEWMKPYQQLETFQGSNSTFPFQSLAFPGITWKKHFDIVTGYVKDAYLPDQPPLVRPASSTPRRLRIGYFSGDFRAHPVGFLIPNVIELHDRNQFEVIGYSVGADQQSDIRKRIATAFDRFVDLGPMISRQSTDVIRADDLDILINLQGWTNDSASELLAKRSAPVQISWLGYAGTMGHPNLADYLIGDPIATPLERSEFFTETLALLDCCYLPMDTTVGIPKAVSRRDAGLPEDAFVFCSFNNRYKINPPQFDVWCDILRQCPNSILWISNDRASANANLVREFEKRGLPASRLIFAARTPSIEGHRDRISAADLALDPTPYNSHSSGLDMLWAGVPMITQLGQTFHSRVGASLLHHCHLDELITQTADEYRDLAIRLYHDRDRLRQLRKKLEEGRTTAPLWNTGHLTRSLETIYRTAYANYLAGNKVPIVVNPLNQLTTDSGA